MKIKINKFLETGAILVFGTLDSVGLTLAAQNLDILSPPTNVIFSSNASFGVGLIGAAIGVVLTKLVIEGHKNKQNDESVIQFTSKPLKF